MPRGPLACGPPQSTEGGGLLLIMFELAGSGTFAPLIFMSHANDW